MGPHNLDISRFNSKT